MKKFLFFTMTLMLMYISQAMSANAAVSVEVKGKDGTVHFMQTHDSEVTLVHNRTYQHGDTIVITTPFVSPYLLVNLDPNVGEALVYAPSGTITYTVPTNNPDVGNKDSLEAYHDSAFRGNSHTITARIATDEEISAYRNVALNPIDLRRQSINLESGRNNQGTEYLTEYYPHAKANAVTRDEGEYEERNAIDGKKVTAGHGPWPYQSWGGGRLTDLEFTVEFGRVVEIDRIDLYLRTDYETDHDTYWKNITIKFSDGTETIAALSKTGAAQTINFSPKRVSSIQLVNFVPETETGFAAISEIEVWGKDVKAESLPLQKADVIDTMKLVNDYWIATTKDLGWVDWTRSVYNAGNMAMYNVYPEKKYYDYSVRWGTNNSWKLCPDFNNNPSADAFRNPDDHCAGQAFAELYQYTDLEGVAAKEKWIAKITEHVEGMLDPNNPKADDWWWVDAVYMAMPTFAKLGVIWDDTRFFDKMYEMYSHTRNVRTGEGLYAGNREDEPKLWWRDYRYIPTGENGTSPNGKKVFWSRGNGWAFGALVRVLEVLPKNDPHYNEYLQDFKDMAEELIGLQRPDGYWYSNLDDPEHFGGPEVSGTSLFIYGFAWGMNNGILDTADFLQPSLKAWNAMSNTAVHHDGFLGYVQRVAAAPGPAAYSHTADFGVGAFLQAGSELVKLAEGDMPSIEETGTPLTGLDYSLSYKVGGVNNAKSLQPNQRFSGNFGIYNPDGGAKKVFVAAALYDSNGRVNLVSSEIRDIGNSSRIVNIPVSFTLPGDVLDYECKVFAWDVSAGLTPFEDELLTVKYRGETRKLSPYYSASSSLRAAMNQSEGATVTVNFNVLGNGRTDDGDRIMINKTPQEPLGTDYYFDLVFEEPTMVDYLEIWARKNLVGNQEPSEVRIEYMDQATQKWKTIVNSHLMSYDDGEIINSWSTEPAHYCSIERIPVDMEMRASVIRVYILDARRTWNNFGISEMVAYGMSMGTENTDGKNLLTTKAVNITNPDISGINFQNLNDGKFGTVFSVPCTTGTTTSVTTLETPYTIEFDFETETNINAMRLFTRLDQQNSVVEADLQYYNGAGWVTGQALTFMRYNIYTGAITNSSLDYVELDNSMVSSKFRLVIKKVKSVGGKFEINELAFYGE